LVSILVMKKKRKLVAPICLLKKFPRETSLGLSHAGKTLLWTGVIQYLAYCISN
jgi:hypothetical protein